MITGKAKGAPVEVRTVYDLLAAFVADVNQRPGGRRTTYRQHRLRTLRLEKLVGDVAVANLSAATLDRLVRQLVAETLADATRAGLARVAFVSTPETP